ncbi:MAG: DNA-binding protein [Chloroflexi bacterium]|nr:DNA-binding protein [Chloroflexota bacterium]
MGSIKKLHLFRLNMGEDLLAGLQLAVREAGIQQGAILQAVGSLTSYHVHVVGEKRRPVPNLFFRGQGGYDLLAMQGYVIDGRVHAHITISDTERAVGGHLEPGCEVYTFVLITVAELEGVALTDLDKVRWPEG